jgi:oligopeptide transport system substrate-binding protein
MGHPAKPLPAGGRLRPELAEAEPSISRDGKTYTFRIRKGARFSNGVPVTARAFERSIQRVLDPAMGAFGASGIGASIVGGEDVLAGRAARPRGVTASGRVLTLRLRKRNPLFLDMVTTICAVPPDLAADPEGAKAPLPSAAPYYVAEYVPGTKLVLLRNRFYRGNREHHVDRIDADLGADAEGIIDDIASGKLDWGDSVIAPRARAGELSRRYRKRFFVRPQLFLRMFVLNTSRPLFRNNPRLRQAVNFAVDRRALTRELGPYAGIATDQYLAPSQPGYTDERIYPLKGPDLRKARALARGSTRARKAVLYTTTSPVDVAQAQVLQRNLKAIGIDLEIVQFPGPADRQAGNGEALVRHRPGRLRPFA